jgi:hypothetical protein
MRTGQYLTRLRAMIHTFFPTLAIAAIGLFSAKAGDLLRGAPRFGRKPCQTKHVSVVAWRYEAETPQQRGAWLPIHDRGTC